MGTSTESEHIDIDLGDDYHGNSFKVFGSDESFLNDYITVPVYRSQFLMKTVLFVTSCTNKSSSSLSWTFV